MDTGKAHIRLDVVRLHNLFNNTNSFKVVSDILGHKSIESTTSYVRVDFELLRSIASPWPRNGGEVND